MEEHDDVVAYWLKQIKKEERSHKKWREAAEKVEDRFVAEKKDRRNFYPILWSNTKILQSAIYARTAQPDVRRRFKDNGVDQKQIAVAIERSISYQVDMQRFDANINRAVTDYLVAACGQCRVRYEVEGEEEITNQKVTIESYSWKHFHWEPAKSWEYVDWVAFDHNKTRKEIKDEFGVELDSVNFEEAGDEAGADRSEILIHEIYDKRTRKVYVVSKHHQEPLDVREDKLGLNGFFPCPKPMLANCKTDRLVPKPDYTYYQSQANRLSEIEQRIESMTKGLKDVGFYDAALTELGSLETAQDGNLIPINNLMERLQGTTDLNKASIAMLPIGHKMEVLTSLRQEQEALKQEIYDITGIADIVRGSSMASETATAQQIKGQWANVRLTDKQTAVNEFVREIFRIMAEIISEHFLPEMIAAQTGIQLEEQDVMTMRQDSLRGFAIDVETDSTVAIDEQAEQEQRLSMLSTVTEYLTNLVPMIQQGAMPAKLGVELLLTAVRSFKYGRNLEEMVSAIGEENSPENMIVQLQQQLQETQMQMEQMHQEAGMAVQQRDEHIAGLEKQLSGLNDREQARKDAEAQAANELKGAQAEKAQAETMQIIAENTAEAAHAGFM